MIFDIKGDLLGAVRNILTAVGRSKDLVILGPGEPFAFDPLIGLSPAQISNLLIAASAITGQESSQRARQDDLFWSNNRLEMLTAICEIATLTTKAAGNAKLSLLHLQRLARTLHQPKSDLLTWAKDLRHLLSDSSATAIEGMSSMPETTKACVASSVSQITNLFAREPAVQLMTPAKDRTMLELGEVLFEQGKVIVITAGSPEHTAQLLPAMLLFKSALFHLILARRRRPELNQERSLWIAIDEFGRTYLPHESMGAACEHVTLEMARANGAGFLLAAQNLCGLESVSGDTLVSKLVALCRTIILFANSCPSTDRLAQRVFGTRKSFREQITEDRMTPAPLLIPRVEKPSLIRRKVRVPITVPVLPAEQLARLKTGEAFLKLADGSIHKLAPISTGGASASGFNS